MKFALIIFTLAGLAAQELQSQGVTVQVQRPDVRVVDPVVVRQRLSIAPRVIVTPAPVVPSVAVPVAPPVRREIVETTTTTVTPAAPIVRRVYHPDRHVVVVQEKEQTVELPYMILPVLFVKETAELLDQESRAALEQTAGTLTEIARAEPTAVFDIEGHTSTDGTDEFNMNLSAARAQRVYDELTQRYGVPAKILSAHGYGENFPRYPQGTEAEMQEDRRVLVVRAK
jgi:outer membrane protein OmpA-like peptidoglycan-associated protein